MSPHSSPQLSLELHGDMAQHYRKTGGSFSEALGASPSGAVTADRLIHAIDGLRKAQDEDKTGSKGVVASLKEPEKLDVFLARDAAKPRSSSAQGYMARSYSMASSGLATTLSICSSLFAGPCSLTTGWFWR